MIRSCWVLLAAVLGAVALAGCGSSTNTVTLSVSTAPEKPTAGSTTATTAADVPSLPAPIATWHFTWPVEGGYSYSGSLSLGAPEHINTSVIAPCTANGSTDAQIRGSVELTNDTKGFPGEPVLDFETQALEGVNGRISFGGGSSCLPESEGGDGIEYSPGHTLAPGASDSFSIVMIIPGYYSPEHPNGDPGLLKGYQFTTVAFKPEGSDLGAGPVKVTGPAIESFGPNTNPRFSLGAVGRE
jgi:hypothetical protein